MSWSVVKARAQSVCCMTTMRRTPSIQVARISERSTSRVTRPPALRRILASPGRSPSTGSGSMRVSMQVTRANPLAARAGSPTLSKRAAKRWFSSSRSSNMTRAWQTRGGNLGVQPPNPGQHRC